MGKGCKRRANRPLSENFHLERRELTLLLLSLLEVVGKLAAGAVRRKQSTTRLLSWLTPTHQALARSRFSFSI